MKRVITTIAFALCFSANAQKPAPQLPMDTYEVSNSIVLPKCEIDVEFQAVRWLIPEASWPATGKPRNYVVKAKVTLNGQPVQGSDVLGNHLVDPSRVLPPPAKIKCGFVVQQGDASTSARTLVILTGTRIGSIEQISFAGRTFSKTLLFYPKAFNK
jgi:hypothetical protein